MTKGYNNFGIVCSKDTAKFIVLEKKLKTIARSCILYQKTPNLQLSNKIM